VFHFCIIILDVSSVFSIQIIVDGGGDLWITLGVLAEGYFEAMYGG
jgi:hypothetical protein